MVVAAAILALTYIGVIFTRLPHINIIDRPAMAMLGGLLMVILGVLTVPEAVGTINFNTIALLLGMLLLLAALWRAGFFTVMAARSVAIAAQPWQLLSLVVVATALGSAFLVRGDLIHIYAAWESLDLKNRDWVAAPATPEEAG